MVLLYSGTYLSIALASEIECQTSYPLQVSMRAMCGNWRALRNNTNGKFDMHFIART